MGIKNKKTNGLIIPTAKTAIVLILILLAGLCLSALNRFYFHGNGEEKIEVTATLEELIDISELI